MFPSPAGSFLGSRTQTAHPSHARAAPNKTQEKLDIMNHAEKPRLLVFIVAYNAEKTISSVVRRIPASLTDSYEVEVLIIDDASPDFTFARSHYARKAAASPFPIRALMNPVNQGYVGNQKLGYHYAIENHYDFVPLPHRHC